jgi:glucose repression regulatory protein TUP1
MDVSVICSTAFGPDGSSLAIGSDKTLRVYAVDRNDFLFQSQLEEADTPHTNHIRPIAWTSDGRSLVTGGEDGRVRIFSLAERVLCNTIDVGSGEVFQVCVANRGDFFAAVSGPGFLSLYRLSNLTLIERLARETDSTTTLVAISSDDRLIAVGDGDYHVALWDTQVRRLASLHCCHASGVYAVKFVPRQQRLVTGSLDSTVKIWDIYWDSLKGPTLELRAILEGHSSYVLSLAIDPQGELLVSGSNDLTARVSSVSRSVMLYSIKAHSNSVITVAFSPLGIRFCTGSGDQSVKIWTVAQDGDA